MTARILVIEDNPANLELMLYLLETFGYHPLAAGDGEEGVAVALREKPDVIICDLQLPKLHGLEVARQLKSDAQFHAQIVAVTAFAMVGDRDKILAAGFDGYIPKPLNPETFVRDVEAFLKPADRLPGRPLARSWPSPSLKEAAKEEARAVEKRPTILSVDNSQINRSLIRDILEPLGFEVISAHTVPQALELAKQVSPDLLLSDVHMPEKDGFDFIRAVKADPQLRSIPFIFISSTVQLDNDRSLALALGASKFIERPIEPLALVAEIQDCLRTERK